MLQTIIKAAAAVAIALSLSACNTPVITGDEKVDAVLAQAADIANKTCGITIIAAQIVQMIPNPTAVTAAGIAAALCTALTQANQKVVPGSPTVLTVPVTIEGKRVDVVVKTGGK